jgi:monoamine oxidase
MRALAELVRVRAAADRAGVSSARVREEAATATRRGFLRAAGAGLAGAALSLDVARGTSFARGRERIAIVGAGIAGLTCALTLRDAGIDSVIYESQRRVGGRMHSERSYWDNGQHTEWCGAMIDSKHRAMHELASRFGLPLVDTWAALPQGARDTVYIRNAYYPMEDADRDFAPVYATLQKQLAAAGSVTSWNRSTAEGRRLDNLPLGAWIDRYVPGGVKSKLGTLIAQAYVNEYGRELDQQSSLNLVYMLGDQLDGYDADRKLNVLGYSDQRYFIDGGNQRLPEAIAASLPAGSIKFGHRLSAIGKRGGGYGLRFTTATGTFAASYDRVVIAIPFSVLRGVDYSGAGFDARKTNAIERLGYGTHTKTHVQFTSRPWDGKGRWPDPVTGAIWTDLSFQNSTEFTLGQNGGSGIIERFTGGNSSLLGIPETPYAFASKSAIVRNDVKTFLTQLDEVWPGVSRAYNGKATYGNAQADPNALGTYSCWLLGQYTTIAGYEGVRQGNVFFAGEHCSLDDQGFMEGGAQTGIAAGRAILADYGLKRAAS